MTRDAYPALTADILAFADAIRPSDDELSRRRAALDIVTAAVKREWPDADVNAFGSAACGTTLPSSDIDLAVNGKEWQCISPRAATNVDEANVAIKPAMIRGVRRLADRLRVMCREGSPIGHVMAITRSRVPIVRTKIRSVGVDVVFGRAAGVPSRSRQL